MATYTNDAKNTSTFTQENRSDYVAGRTARLGKAKLSIMRLGRDTEFSVFTNDSKNTSTYGNDTKN